jgi:hypothetical protein
MNTNILKAANIAKTKVANKELSTDIVKSRGRRGKESIRRKL